MRLIIRWYNDRDYFSIKTNDFFTFLQMKQLNWSRAPWKTPNSLKQKNTKLFSTNTWEAINVGLAMRHYNWTKKNIKHIKMYMLKSKIYDKKNY